jgi:hypothetical protein
MVLGIQMIAKATKTESSGWMIIGCILVSGVTRYILDKLEEK